MRPLEASLGSDVVIVMKGFIPLVEDVEQHLIAQVHWRAEDDALILVVLAVPVPKFEPVDWPQLFHFLSATTDDDFKGLDGGEVHHPPCQHCLGLEGLNEAD